MTDEMEKIQRKVKDAVNSMVDELDKRHLRELQRQMFSCSAKCCEDRVASRDNMEKCVDECNAGMRKAQRALETELTSLQEQFSRCAMSCYDKQIQLHGPEPANYDEKQMERFQGGLDKCMAICGDEHVALLPKMRDRLSGLLKGIR